MGAWIPEAQFFWRPTQVLTPFQVTASAWAAMASTRSRAPDQKFCVHTFSSEFVSPLLGLNFFMLATYRSTSGALPDGR